MLVSRLPCPTFPIFFIFHLSARVVAVIIIIIIIIIMRSIASQWWAATREHASALPFDEIR